MADHIGVGKIDNDQIMAGRPDGGFCLVTYIPGRHFRLLVIGRDLWRINQLPLFAAKGRIASAIEKERNMRIFFRFGKAKLFQAMAGYHLSQSLAEVRRGQ